MYYFDLRDSKVKSSTNKGSKSIEINFFDLNEGQKFDDILFKNPIKRFIEIPYKKFHSKSSFFMLIIDLPKDIQQIIMFFPHPVITTKIYENNVIIQHLRKLINNSINIM